MIGWGCNTKEHGEHGNAGTSPLRPQIRLDQIMAKNISVAEALAALAENGVDFAALGMEDAVTELTNSALKSRAVSIIAGDGDKFPGKLIEKPTRSASQWADFLFDVAEEFANDFVGEVKNVQGGATRMVRVVGIDTPAGHLKIELRSE